MSICEYLTSRGRCTHEAIANCRFCSDHSAKAKITMVNEFRIACKALGDAPQRHAASDQLKSINGEIVILRSMVETRLNMVQNDVELIAAMPVITQALVSCAKLAETSHAMDVKLGNLLSKNALISLAQEIIEIIENTLRPFVGQEVTDQMVDEAIENVGISIVAAVAAKDNPDK